MSGSAPYRINGFMTAFFPAAQGSRMFCGEIPVINNGIAPVPSVLSERIRNNRTSYNYETNYPYSQQRKGSFHVRLHYSPFFNMYSTASNEIIPANPINPGDCGGTVLDGAGAGFTKLSALFTSLFAESTSS